MIEYPTTPQEEWTAEEAQMAATHQALMQEFARASNGIPPRTVQYGGRTWMRVEGDGKIKFVLTASNTFEGSYNATSFDPKKAPPATLEEAKNEFPAKKTRRAKP